MLASEPTDTLTAALELAAEGIPVFLLSRTKRPVGNCLECSTPAIGPSHDREACPCLTCHAFYAATRDAGRIRDMHGVVPGGLLAIRTGVVSDLVVIDIDPRNGGLPLPELMPATRAVRTGSDGWHLYYKHPGGRFGSRLRGHPGIDVKADGGYVVAPPSVHPGTGQPYRWVGERAVIEMPPGLVAACRPAESPAPLSPGTWSSTTPRGGGISDPAALLAAKLDALARAPEGQRRATLFGVACGVGEMIAAGALTPHEAYEACYQAGRAAGQSHRETHAAIVGGFAKSGIYVAGRAA